MAILEPLAHHWLALCLCTESNRPEEWPYIAAVIFNRVDSPRYPGTLEDVILQRKQFSAFNEFTTAKMSKISRRDIFEDVAANQVATRLCRAVDLAGDLRRDGAVTKETIHISRATLHYYSPVSMVPKGSAPPWAKTAKRLYTPAGVDPQRFIFAEGVA